MHRAKEHGFVGVGGQIRPIQDLAVVALDSLPEGSAQRVEYKSSPKKKHGYVIQKEKSRA